MRWIGFEMITLVSTQWAAFYIPPFFIEEIEVVPETVDGAFEQVHTGVFLYGFKMRARGSFLFYKNRSGNGFGCPIRQFYFDAVFPVHRIFRLARIVFISGYIHIIARYINGTRK